MIAKIVDVVQRHPIFSLFFLFIGVFLFQSLNLFWGFEVVDSGFHLTAYDNIFDAPDSVSYNFMYYLTNVIGGLIMQIFPSIGILGFRLVGALFVDFSVLLIFICLRKEIPIIHLLIGEWLVVMSYIQIPYSFNNGICSCFFYVCALLSLYKGLISKKKTLVFLSGIFVGINIFSRIPNLLAVGIALIILFHIYIESGRIRYDRKSTILFLFGVLSGISIMLLLIIICGHQHAFTEALNVLLLQATGQSSTSSLGHSWNELLWTPVYFYLHAIVFVTLFFTVSYVCRHLEKKSIKVFFSLLASFTIFYHVYLNFGYEPLWAICIMGCICLIMKNDKVLLTTLAFFMLIFETLGSDSGNNHGSLPALLAAPVASYALLNRKNIIFVLVVCMAFFLKVVKHGNYFDFGSLLSKTYSINAKECYMIRTTEERAEAMNTTLPLLKRYVLPEDTLLVFNSAPMMNFLTHSRAAGGMCWPLMGSVKSFESPPKILIHKFDDFAGSLQPTRGVRTGNQMIDTYMKEHQYHIVWENSYFILLFPSKK